MPLSQVSHQRVTRLNSRKAEMTRLGGDAGTFADVGNHLAGTLLVAQQYHA